MLSAISGFANVLTPQYLLLAAIGVTIGTAIGVLPGIGPVLTVTLLLPLTYNFDPTGALIMFAGIYYGGMDGGSTTSILLNTPGESASVATTFEGFAMAKSGRAGAALATAAVGSFVAGTLSPILLTFVAPLLARVALLFQPADYFALTVLAFVSVTALVGSSVIRGMISLFIGLFFGLIGIDILSGQVRMTFGIVELLDGIDVVVVAVGLFAVGEALYVASQLRHSKEEILSVRSSIWMNCEEWQRSWPAWLRGALIGFSLGALPAGGAEIPTFLSYTIEKRLSKHKEEWGHGAIEGVAGPEAANNAAFSGVLVPLLTLSLPTSATAAILLASFQIYNLQPGPLLFQKAPDLVWTLVASLYIGNMMLLILNLPLIRIWVKILTIPRPLLYSEILVFGTLGVYSMANSFIDVLLMYAIGVIGFFMRRFQLPVGPAILSLILLPLAEAQFRRALAISQGDLSVFVPRPLSLGLLLAALAALVLPYLPALAARLTGKQTGPRRLVFGKGDED
ncbi:tripartite tricarboxylate transporter permease [uncultured Chloroflexus sp.]|uniref:tripartite tricarboxylate transporter permease n=1 Tax=uncultured Chloroflexus sp. TaxID=214040 RepID=UPI0026338CFD|nr:tripartite tricarboxylate transporter permease [uncultured Chloroflexus sp.]